jgi:hypothetical protein
MRPSAPFARCCQTAASDQLSKLASPASSRYQNSSIFCDSCGQAPGDPCCTDGAHVAFHTLFSPEATKKKAGRIWGHIHQRPAGYGLIHQTKSNQISNQTKSRIKPNQTKPNQTKPNQTNPRIWQGIFAIISCVRSGEIEISPATGMPALPPPRFWVAAAAANSLLSLVKMLETRAYSGRASKSRSRQNPQHHSCICSTDPKRQELNRIYQHPNRVRHVSMCALPRV